MALRQSPPGSETSFARNSADDVRRWLEANASAGSSAMSFNRRAEAYDAPGRVTQEELIAIRERATACFWCDASLSSQSRITLDHIWPLSKGFPNRVENLRAACPSCNSKKSDADPRGFCRKSGRLDRLPEVEGILASCDLSDAQADAQLSTLTVYRVTRTRTKFAEVLVSLTYEGYAQMLMPWRTKVAGATLPHFVASPRPPSYRALVMYDTCQARQLHAAALLNGRVVHLISSRDGVHTASEAPPEAAAPAPPTPSERVTDVDESTSLAPECLAADQPDRVGSSGEYDDVAPGKMTLTKVMLRFHRAQEARGRQARERAARPASAACEELFEPNDPGFGI